jgi:hypothetical protein
VLHAKVIIRAVTSRGIPRVSLEHPVDAVALALRSNRVAPA